MSSEKIDIDKDLIRDLADILNETDLSEIEVERAGFRIKVARTLNVHMSASAPPAPVASAAPDLPSAAKEETGALGPSGSVVTSPMVGTAYRAAEPGAKPFVEVGDQVEEGQTILIVEAMKTFNPIPAPRSGVVKAILVADQQPVEFGEPLMTIE
ncbi:MAG: acetyl-CoA carboxylase biotin carboxyl carrier protein [Hyphomicrobiales bacterium]|nr:acetyl-CoA carboxylase biotin carboxyl carrier protein [Hyphomicrobiales bacterium]